MDKPIKAAHKLDSCVLRQFVTVTNLLWLLRDRLLAENRLTCRRTDKSELLSQFPVETDSIMCTVSLFVTIGLSTLQAMPKVTQKMEPGPQVPQRSASRRISADLQWKRSSSHQRGVVQA